MLNYISGQVGRTNEDTHKGNTDDIHRGNVRRDHRGLNLQYGIFYS